MEQPQRREAVFIGMKRDRRKFGTCKPLTEPRSECKRWLLRLYLGEDSNGKRKYFTETFNGTGRKAEERLRDVEQRHLAGEPLKPTPESLDSFGALVNEFLTSRKLSVAESSHAQYRRLVRLYLEKDEIMRLVTSQIEAGDVEKLYLRLEAREEKLSRSTIRLVHILLTMIFKFGVERKKLKGSPMVAVRAPRVEEDDETQKSMDIDQARRFLEACKGSRFETLFRFALHAGTRPGEALALQWSDIDPKTSTVTIRRNIVWRRPNEMEPGQDKWYLKSPKSRRSKRPVTVTPAIIATLGQERRRQLEMRLKAGRLWRDHGFVWTNAIGEPFRTASLHYEMGKILKRAGLPLSFNPHALRHTVISLLIADNADVVSVARQAGHSKTSITTDVYGHAQPGSSAALSAQIEALLDSACNTGATENDADETEALKTSQLHQILR